jgi:hypothetical protein
LRIPWESSVQKNFDILQEDQISLIFDILRVSHENRACQNLWYLTSNTSCNQFLFITYIIKMKRANPAKKNLPLLKDDITNNLEPQKRVIYSRYMTLTTSILLL